MKLYFFRTGEKATVAAKTKTSLVALLRGDVQKEGARKWGRK